MTLRALTVGQRVTLRTPAMLLADHGAQLDVRLNGKGVTVDRSEVFNPYIPIDAYYFAAAAASTQLAVVRTKRLELIAAEEKLAGLEARVQAEIHELLGAHTLSEVANR